MIVSMPHRSITQKLKFYYRTGEATDVQSCLIQSNHAYDSVSFKLLTIVKGFCIRSLSISQLTVEISDVLFRLFATIIDVRRSRVMASQIFHGSEEIKSFMWQNNNKSFTRDLAS